MYVNKSLFFFCSVVDPRILNLDPDPEFWLNLYPDPEFGSIWIRIRKFGSIWLRKGYAWSQFLKNVNKMFLKYLFFNYKKIMAPEDIFFVLNLTHFDSNLSYFYLCGFGSGSIFGIRIHKVAESMDPDPPPHSRQELFLQIKYPHFFTL